MNCFQYKIYESVYNDIISFKKNIEFRLLNEKSESIKVGDEIKFKVLENEEKFILVEVMNKHIYDNIDELWSHKEILNNTLNCTKEEFTELFYNIYGEEKVINSKVVGIEFRVKN